MASIHIYAQISRWIRTLSGETASILQYFLRLPAKPAKKFDFFSGKILKCRHSYAKLLK